jgi:geranylgeranyl diphosphate synthase type II
LELEKYLSEKAALVNDTLKRLLVREDEYPQSLHKAIHYSLFAGGKRIRPVLTLASAQAVGGSADDALPAACAIECIHTYSLIHDDLPAIDNDELRRGRATCHKVFGEAMAILAGDALLTVAFELMSEGLKTVPDPALRAIYELSRAAGSTGMIGGQVVDIESEGKEISFPMLEYIHTHKTGKLMLASVRCGAILGGASVKELESLTDYGRSIGLAFQIADDILDVEGDSAELGKSTGTDALLGKATYPSLLGLDESRTRAGELVERAVDALSDFTEAADPLREIARLIVTRKN